MEKFLEAIRYAKEKRYVLAYHPHWNRYFVGITRELNNDFEFINDYK